MGWLCYYHHTRFWEGLDRAVGATWGQSLAIRPPAILAAVSPRLCQTVESPAQEEVCAYKALPGCS